MWATGVGRCQVSHGVPVGADALEFQFHGDSRDAVFRELVSTPGLRARIAMDRATGQIIGVTFEGRP